MRGRIFLAATVAVVCAATSALAVDAQGTWTGKQVCKLFDGSKAVDKFDSTMTITQSGSSVSVNVDGDEFVYFGLAIDSADKPGTGELGLTDCDPDFDEVVRLSVKGDKIKGRSIYRDVNENDTCKWIYKRTDTAPPSMVPCPD